MEEFYQASIGEVEGKLVYDLRGYKRSSILVRSPNWLGDTVMAIKAMESIQKILYPYTQIIVLCDQSLSSLWKSYDWVGDCVEIIEKKINKEEKEKLKIYNPQVAIIFPNSFRSALEAFKLKIPIRIGRKQEARGNLLTHKIPQYKHKKGEHEIKRYLEIALACGVKKEEIKLKPRTLTFDDELLKLLEIEKEYKNYLVIAIGAAYGEAKKWPLEYFSDIVSFWATIGYKTVFVGGEDKEENKFVENMCERFINCYNMMGGTDLYELSMICKLAKVVLSNDSGVMHLAASVGATGIAIFGSTDENATGPLFGKWTILNKKYDCSPCFERTCSLKIDKYKCLRHIYPDDVIEVIQKIRKMSN